MLDQDTANRFGTEQAAIYLTKGQVDAPWLSAWWVTVQLRPTATESASVALALVMRGRPRAVIIDGRGDEEWRRGALEVCRRLKADTFTAVVPVAMIVPSASFCEAFACGADEVLKVDVAPEEARVRLDGFLRRSDRDTAVHPSTRLCGTREIEADIARRMQSAAGFAACYADLDHFKEFNDRYGYHHGDRTICLVARILHDVVKGRCGSAGFVGHIGGDDFLFVVPVADMPLVCDEVIEVFGELIALQYSEQDRRVGYYFGKDRRGQMHRVPLMTLSIGVATNQHRRFARAVEVSELATEMKTYAKTLPGSVWVVDRRRDDALLASLNLEAAAAASPPPATNFGATP